MPWEHCGQSILDEDDCPSCGIDKTSWTVEFNVTRTFQVRRKKGGQEVLRLLLLDAEERPVANEPYAATLPNGERVRGSLDEYGAAKVESAEAGKCVIEFPNRSAADVQHAGGGTLVPGDGPGPL